MLALVQPCSSIAGTAHAAGFGSFEQPFSAESPWNRRPLEPRLGDYRLPPTRYLPFVGGGDYTTGAFLCRDGDRPMQVQGNEPHGVWIVDEGVSRTLELPCWPADVRPAAGGDGHAEIVDPARGIVHSFWQLRRDGGSWRASQYAWSRLDGPGWPDPAHNHQGARAAGVPTIGGLIRRHEIHDGHPLYHHVLAMSLDGSALRTGYVAPAAGQDNDADATYRGQIPMGSLLMLPAKFAVDELKTPALRKVARTLMAYGAAVVDRNTDTRFVIYVEQGADFDLHKGTWNQAAADDLQRIADALRPVHGQSGWRDGLGRPIATTQPNLLSMRGPWRLDESHGRRNESPPGHFDSWRQALVFTGASGPGTSLRQEVGAQRTTRWAPWSGGERYRLSASGSPGTTLRLQFLDDRGRTLWQSRWLTDGESEQFEAPGDTRHPILNARNASGHEAWIRGDLKLHDGRRPSPH
ncbi:MAG: Atrophin-1 multi-domain protein [Burkholderiaceae bacterium]